MSGRSGCPIRAPSAGAKSVSVSNLICNGSRRAAAATDRRGDRLRGHKSRRCRRGGIGWERSSSATVAGPDLAIATYGRIFKTSTSSRCCTTNLPADDRLSEEPGRVGVPVRIESPATISPADCPSGFSPGASGARARAHALDKRGAEPSTPSSQKGSTSGRSRASLPTFLAGAAASHNGKVLCDDCGRSDSSRRSRSTPMIRTIGVAKPIASSSAC